MLWLNGFTAFSIKPLRVSVYMGVLVAVLGFILLIYSLLNKILNPEVPMGWTSMIAIVSLVGGATLMVLGMIGEYIGRIYMTVNRAPQYVIKEIKGDKMLKIKNYIFLTITFLSIHYRYYLAK